MKSSRPRLTPDLSYQNCCFSDLFYFTVLGEDACMVEGRNTGDENSIIENKSEPEMIMHDLVSYHER